MGCLSMNVPIPRHPRSIRVHEDLIVISWVNVVHEAVTLLVRVCRTSHDLMTRWEFLYQADGPAGVRSTVFQGGFASSQWEA